MADARPIAAYLATLVVNGVPHRIRTTGRDEKAIRANFHEAALRRTRAFYDLDVLDDDGEPRQLVVEWGNVDTWDVTDLVRGGTWEQGK